MKHSTEWPSTRVRVVMVFALVYVVAVNVLSEVLPPLMGPLFPWFLAVPVTIGVVLLSLASWEISGQIARDIDERAGK